MKTNGTNDWILNMGEDDLNFIKNFILNSGSLKQLAKQYNVSYPTVRLKLDRLIEKIKIASENTNASPFERFVTMKYSEGKIDSETKRKLIDLHNEDLNK